MSRETRNNLIFIVILIAATAPGAVILFNKKYNGGRAERPGMMPEARPTDIVYIDPFDGVPSYMKRVVPRLLGTWLETESRQRAGKSVANITTTEGESGPIISADRRWQAVAFDTKGSTLTIHFAGWDKHFTADAASYTLVAADDSKNLPATIDSVEVIPLPESVRTEMINLRYAHPIHNAVWLKATVQNAVASSIEPLTVTITTQSPDGEIKTSFRVPFQRFFPSP